MYKATSQEIEQLERIRARIQDIMKIRRANRLSAKQDNYWIKFLNLSDYQGKMMFISVIL